MAGKCTIKTFQYCNDGGNDAIENMKGKKMNTLRVLVIVAGSLLPMIFSGCAPEEIGDTASPYRPYVKINNNTRYGITKIKGFMGEWGVIGTTWDWHLFPLIDSGESKYVSLKQYYTDLTTKENRGALSEHPIQVYANGRWSTTVLLGPDGKFYDNWDGPEKMSGLLYTRGMTLYLVDGKNGDLYLTNVPVK